MRQDGTKRPQHALKKFQEGPKTPQETPKTPQEAPKRHRDAFGTPPHRQGKDTVQILPRSWAPLPPRGAGVGRQATRRDEGTWAQKLVKILGQCLAAVPQAVSPCWWGPGWDRLGPGDPLISIIKGECPRGSQIAERPTKHRSRCVGGGSQPGPNRSQPVPTAPRVPQNTGPRALGPGPNGYQMSQRPTKHRSPCVGTGSQRVWVAAVT